MVWDYFPTRFPHCGWGDRNTVEIVDQQNSTMSTEDVKIHPTVLHVGVRALFTCACNHLQRWFPCVTWTQEKRLSKQFSKHNVWLRPEGFQNTNDLHCVLSLNSSQQQRPTGPVFQKCSHPKDYRPQSTASTQLSCFWTDCLNDVSNF